MAFGISGDQPSVGNQPSDTMVLVELRVLTALIQQQMGTAMAGNLGRLREDQAFELQITPTPLPGSGR